MKTIILIFTVLAGLSLAFYNGWIYKMATRRDVGYNEVTHFISGWIRFIWMVFIAFIMAFSSFLSKDIIFIEMVAAILFWPMYNFAYNLVHDNPLLYLGSRNTGTKSWIDKTLGKAILPIQGILILVTALWYPLKIYNIINLQPLIERIISNYTEWIVGAALIIVVPVVSYLFLKQKLFKKKN